MNAEKPEKLALEDTVLRPGTVERDGVKYRTYRASVRSELFREWAQDAGDLIRAAEEYAGYLYQRIEERKLQEQKYPYLTMSREHIAAELKAHLFCWFLLQVPNTEIADMNVDESRTAVLTLMRLMGYTGREETDLGPKERST